MKFTTFLALGAIVGVDLNSPADPKQRTKAQRRQRQKQDALCIKREISFPEKGGRLAQISKHLSKLCVGYIDKPNYQCRCLKKQKDLFWQLQKARKTCLGRKKAHEDKQDRKENQQERKERQKQNKADKKAKKEAEKNRTRRSAEEEDLLGDDEEIINADALSMIEQDTQKAMELEEGGSITTTDMEDLINEQCGAPSDADDEEECNVLRKATSDLEANEQDEDAKERADIIYRIIKMHKAMANWAESYIANVDCDKRKKMINRAKKNRRRMQTKRLSYPTNPLKLKKLKAEAKKEEQLKEEKRAQKAADKAEKAEKKQNKN